MPTLIIIFILFNYSFYIIRLYILLKYLVSESFILYFIKWYLKYYPRYLIYILSLLSSCSSRLSLFLVTLSIFIYLLSLIPSQYCKPIYIGVYTEKLISLALCPRLLPSLLFLLLLLLLLLPTLLKLVKDLRIINKSNRLSTSFVRGKDSLKRSFPEPPNRLFPLFLPDTVFYQDMLYSYLSCVILVFRRVSKHFSLTQERVKTDFPRIELGQKCVISFLPPVIKEYYIISW